MIGFACEVAATTARQRVPELIAESLAANAVRTADQPAPPPRHRRRGRLVSGPELTVGTSVIAELVRLAALEVPGVARVGRGGALWRQVLGGRAVKRPAARRPGPGPRLDRRPAWPGARSAGHPGPVRRGRHHRTAAGPRSRLGRRPGRRCRGLTASEADGPAGGSPCRRSSKRTSGSAPPTPSWSVTWPRTSATRRPPSWRASWSRRSWRTAIRSTPRSPGEPPNTRSRASPGWTAHCSVPPYPRCYTPARRPGWPSPSGSSWHARTVETRCDAS